MLLLTLALAIPYTTAAFLGATLGKLKAVSPLLQVAWCATLMSAGSAQIAAILVIAHNYFVPVPPGVTVALVVVSSVTLAQGLLLAMVMPPVPQEGHGDVPKLSSVLDVVCERFDEGNFTLVVAICFVAAIFFPLVWIARETSRVLTVGILRA